MRIIAGKYRGRKLRSPPSLATRPTSDRLRETLFNILAPRIKGARFLDLCAGSGAVGIEALSRGASHVTFVDQSRKMRALIEANVGALEVNEDEIELVTAEALEFLHQSSKTVTRPFDVIFYDPPYAGDYQWVLEHVGKQSTALLTDVGIVVVEHRRKNDLARQFGVLESYRVLSQGDSCLSFYRTMKSVAPDSADGSST